jgi:hypothetical protein
MDAVEALSGTPETLAAVQHVRKWLERDAMYDAIPPRSAEGVPTARLSKAFIARLEEVDMIERIAPSEIRGHVEMFKVAEEAKRRFRPIKHTRDCNDALGKETLMPLVFPSKKEIVQLVNKGDYFISLDFSAYYDQFEYAPEVRSRFCFQHDGATYCLRKLAMGQRQAVEVAQSTTNRLLDFPRESHVRSVIDNVIFVGKREAVIRDARKFTERVNAVGAQLNEDVTDVEALVRQSGEWCGVHLDLASKCVQLTQKSIDKTQVSWANRRSWTWRQFAAHIGLLFWAWDIIDLPMADFFPVLRFISRAGSFLTENEKMWDSPAFVWPSVWPTLERWTMLVLRNAPRRVAAPQRPQWIVACDASAWGWGYVAFNTATGEIRAHGERWSRAIIRNIGDRLGKSTFSEPQAVLNSLCHLLRGDDPRHVVLLTDNTVAQASYTRGFNSHSFHINDCLRRLRNVFGDRFEFTFAYIPGVTNPADPWSRGVKPSESSWEKAGESLRRYVGMWT